MDFKAIAAKITARFIPFFGKSKTIKQIGEEIQTAADNELAILWSKVKPWLIEEYEENKPLDEDLEEGDVKALVKKKLKTADEATQSAIENILNQNKTTTHIEQHHSGSGDNVGGNKIINSGAKIGQQNINSTVNNGDLNFDFK